VRKYFIEICLVKGIDKMFCQCCMEKLKKFIIKIEKKYRSGRIISRKLIVKEIF